MTNNSQNLRQIAEAEANKDLCKTNTQILTDVHEELLRTDREVEVNIAHANKRIASIMVRTAISSDHASKVLIRLTWIIAGLTVAILIFTGIMVWKQFQ